MNIKCYELIEKESNKEIVSAVLKNGAEKINIIPFKFQPINASYDIEGIESFETAGDITYKIRFSVKNEGEYKLLITYVDNTEEVTELTAKGFDNKGYIKVSDKDKRYFSFTDETSYFPIGVNIVYPTAYTVSDGKEFGHSTNVGYIGLKQYERWFRRFSSHGVNMVRLWLSHNYFTPDTENAEVLRFEQFSKIDMIIALAKKYNIRLKVTFEHFRYFRNKPNSAYTYNLFNKKLCLKDEYCESMKEWLTEEKWRQAWLNKIREFSARYSHDSTIIAVELWNEMNAVEDGLLFSEVCEWNRYMLPKVRELFPNQMVINSLGSLDTEAAYKNYLDFPWHETAFKQVHRYLDQGAKFENATRNPIETIKTGVEMVKDETKPLLVAETGAVDDCHCSQFRYYSADDRGILLVDCVYTAVFTGCAGCGNIWHWDWRYIEAKNIFHLFKPLADVTTDVDFVNEEFKAVDISDDDVYLLLLKGKTVTLGFIRNKNDSWQNNYRDDVEVLPAQNKTFEISGVKSVKCFSIWNDDTTKIEITGDKVSVSDILYGTVFKIEN